MNGHEAILNGTQDLHNSQNPGKVQRVRLPHTWQKWTVDSRIFRWTSTPAGVDRRPIKRKRNRFSSFLVGVILHLRNMSVEFLISSLSLEEKVSLLAGESYWRTASLPKHGIKPIKVSIDCVEIHGLRQLIHHIV
jgi:hypothetical protein